MAATAERKDQKPGHPTKSGTNGNPAPGTDKFHFGPNITAEDKRSRKSSLMYSDMISV